VPDLDGEIAFLSSNSVRRNSTAASSSSIFFFLRLPFLEFARSLLARTDVGQTETAFSSFTVFFFFFQQRFPPPLVSFARTFSQSPPSWSMNTHVETMKYSAALFVPPLPVFRRFSPPCMLPYLSFSILSSLRIVVGYPNKATPHTLHDFFFNCGLVPLPPSTFPGFLQASQRRTFFKRRKSVPSLFFPFCVGFPPIPLFFSFFFQWPPPLLLATRPLRLNDKPHFFPRGLHSFLQAKRFLFFLSRTFFFQPSLLFSSPRQGRERIPSASLVPPSSSNR